MRAEELDSRELVEFDQAAGAVRFAHQRALIMDATAFGSFRADLVAHLGAPAARAMLTRFGHVQGWRLADSLGAQFRVESDDEDHHAGVRCMVMQGMFAAMTAGEGPLAPAGMTIAGSFEAEQQLARLGRSEGTSCWFVCGLLSGYLSRQLDEEIFVLEQSCVGRGDAVCQLFGRTKAQWGDDATDELRFYRLENIKEWIDGSLHASTRKLGAVEAKIRELERAIASVVPDADDPLGIIARSPVMRRLVDLARRVAAVDSTLLITGESGAGKERIARLVHETSSRASGPFVAVNCGAIAETLLESELFGHVRGAFTGAVTDRVGLLEAANGGTLLLDEVGEMSPLLQVKLLRALQEREIRRVGENRVRPIDARVLAATNRDLAERIAAGHFRADLYYRLRVVELRVPALRDRREDILPLARLLQAEAALRLKRQISGMSPAAADQLLRYDWPGNVRELANAMERSVALARMQRTEVEDLPEEIRRALPAPLVDQQVRTLEDVEREYILAALAHNGGNQAATAAQLSIGTATLYRKLKAWGVSRGREVPGGG